MLNKIGTFFGERATDPRWFDYIWIVPFYGLQLFVSLFVRR